MPITSLPPVMQSTDDAGDYADKGDAWTKALSDVWTPEANALEENVNAKEVSATEQAVISATQAGLATTNGAEQVLLAAGQVDLAASQVSLAESQVSLATEQAEIATTQANSSAAAANFKGIWASLAGPISIPASTYNDDEYWALMENVADVTLEEPGVSSKWGKIGAGDVFLNKSQIITNKTLGNGTKIPWITKTADYAATVGENVYCDTSLGVFTVTLPASPVLNDRVGISDYSGTFEDFNLTINGSGINIIGVSENFICDINNLSFTLVYTDIIQGWKIT